MAHFDATCAGASGFSISKVVFLGFRRTFGGMECLNNKGLTRSLESVWPQYLKDTLKIIKIIHLWKNSKIL